MTELRDEVARAQFESASSGAFEWAELDEATKDRFRQDANAAIAIVIERAAKVADGWVNADYSEETVTMAAAIGDEIRDLLTPTDDGGINWGGLLEAYHPDGRVVEVKFRRSDNDGEFTITPNLDQHTNTFLKDGGHIYRSKWRVRNLAPQTTP